MSVKKRLKEFGVGFGVLVLVLFGLFVPWLTNSSLPIWPWIVGIICCVLALSQPVLIKPSHYIFSFVGLYLKKISNVLFLVLMFFLLIAPIVLIRKLIGKDAVPHGFSKSLKT